MTATGHMLLSPVSEGNWGSEGLGSELWEIEPYPLFITTPVHTSLTVHTSLMLPVHIGRTVPTSPAIQAGSNLLLFS